jgi:hypothetical protein
MIPLTARGHRLWRFATLAVLAFGLLALGIILVMPKRNFGFVSQAVCDQMVEGMKYDDVNNIVGFEPYRFFSEPQIADSNYAEWRGVNGTIRVLFDKKWCVISVGNCSDETLFWRIKRHIGWK